MSTKWRPDYTSTFLALNFLFCTFTSVTALDCFLDRQPDPTQENRLRWSLPYKQRCGCTKILFGGNNPGPIEGITRFYTDEPFWLVGNSDQESVRQRLGCDGHELDDATTTIDDYFNDGNECTLETDNCDPNANCTNILGRFTCICNAGYTGDGVTCTDIDECAFGDDNCDPNAICGNTVGSFICGCNVGYSGDGVTCTDHDECALGTNNCDLNAVCINTPGSFTCDCNTGYDGDGISCADVDECTSGDNNCDTNAICSNTVGSFMCGCNTGYSGNGFTCSDNDECTLGNVNCASNAQCTNTPGSFTCTCNEGYSGDGLTCTGPELVGWAPTDRLTGGTDATAYVVILDSQLISVDGYVTKWLFWAEAANAFTAMVFRPSPTSETVFEIVGINEIAAPTTLNMVTTVQVAEANRIQVQANDVIGLAWSYNMSPQTTWEVTGSQSVRWLSSLGPYTVGQIITTNGMQHREWSFQAEVTPDADECTLQTANCDPQATCTNNLGSYTCACITGYTGNGATCSDVNECTLETANCDPQAACTNTDGSFTCACNTGYTGNGATCTGPELVGWAPSDRLTSDTAATAYVVILDSQLISVDGYVTKWLFWAEAANAFTAMVFRPSPTSETVFEIVGINEIAAPTTLNMVTTVLVAKDDHIQVQANDVIGLAWSYNMSPQTTWEVTVTGSESVRWLAYQGPYAVGQIITTNGVQNREWSFQAEVTPDVDECTLQTANCDPHATCTNNLGSYTCACNTGYTGNGATCYDNDECTLETANCDPQATCTNTDGSFTCACNAGYTSNGATCTDIDECLSPGDYNCDTDTAACNNTLGSFVCECKTGFIASGDGTCSDDNECSTAPCSQFATCNNDFGSFACSCNDGFSGDGFACDDIDECAVGVDTCQYGCTNTQGSYSCLSYQIGK